MAISAAEVKKLRDQTGAGMMDCKSALEEANGNFEEANTILRKKGLASAAKKAGRTTSDGLIGFAVSADHSTGTLVEVACETDFVANTDDFKQLIQNVLAEIEKAGDAANAAWLADANGPIHPMVAAAIGKLGENMAVPRFGTEFRAQAVALGLCDPDDLVMDQGGADAFLPTKTLARDEMLALKKDLVRRFYLRPGYLWRRLRSVRNLQELRGQVREGLALITRNL